MLVPGAGSRSPFQASVPGARKVGSGERPVVLLDLRGVEVPVARLGPAQLRQARLDSAELGGGVTVAPRTVGEGEPEVQVPVEELVELAVEAGLVGALEHHGEVAAVVPAVLRPQPGLDHGVELGAGKRVGDGDPDVVGQGLAQEPQGLLDVRKSLAGIAELEEVAGPY